MREFDTETLYMLRLFEDVTGTEARDCVLDRNNGSVVFVVESGKMGLAIGKNGMNIKIVEKLLQKHVRLFEFSEDVEKCIRNLNPQARKIRVDGERAVVWVDPKKRGSVIGKNGSNINLIRKILERNTKITKLEVR